MDGERRLDVGERRDDDAPDALHRVEGQDAAMTLHQAPHHVGLTGRTEGGDPLLGLLHLDQPPDDIAALHQQAVHLGIDRIDFPGAGRRARSGEEAAWTFLINLTKI